MWNKICENIFTEFTQKLNSEQIRYFVLRNYKGLPETNGSKDIDIVIEPKQLKYAKQILKDIFKSNGLEYYDEARFDRMICMHGMSIENKTGIHIDLIGGYRVRGYEIYTFDELYKHTEAYKDFYVLDEFFDGVMLLIYKIFGYKKPILKDEYKQEIVECSKKYETEFRKEIHNLFGMRFGNIVLHAIEENDFDRIIKNQKEFDKCLKKCARKKSLTKTIKGKTAFLWQRADRIIFRYRKFKRVFAVLGPDGSGKSTFIDETIKQMNGYYVNDEKDGRFHLYHFRPTIFPNLGDVGEKAKIMEADKDYTNPHRSNPANPVSSFFRIAYYTMDYIFGWQKCIRKDVHYDRYSIFDRYSYDLLVDPVRTKLNLPRWIRRFFVSLTPRPGVVFILMADADTIYSRKQELDKEEIERQLEEYKKLGKGKRFHFIDATKTPETMASEASKILLDYYAK